MTLSMRLFLNKLEKPLYNERKFKIRPKYTYSRIVNMDYFKQVYMSQLEPREAVGSFRTFTVQPNNNYIM